MMFDLFAGTWRGGSVVSTGVNVGRRGSLGGDSTEGG